MAAYSFQNVTAAIVGPGGAAPLGMGSGASEEGIEIAMKEEKNNMTIGSDGAVMHSLHASNAGRIKIRLLKTSPVNAILSAMYNFQRNNPVGWGTNSITINDVQRGDVASGSQLAFVKHSDVVYAKDGNHNEWEFEGVVQEQLGSGVQNLPF